MKKILSVSLILAIVASILCACELKEDLVINKDGSCKMTKTTIIPVEEIGNAEGVSINGKDVSTLPVKTIDGKECYVDVETFKYKSTKDLEKEMSSDSDGESTEAGSVEKIVLTDKKFEATLSDEVAMFKAMGCKVKFCITFPNKITKTNGVLSNGNKTVTFTIDGNQNKIYAYTNSTSTKKVTIKNAYLKSNSKAYISWKKVSDATKYKVQYKASSNNKWTTKTTTSTSKTISGLKPGKTYKVKITAITKKGNIVSETKYLKTLKKPTIKLNKTTKSSIKLSINKDTAAKERLIYMKSSKKGKWKLVKTLKGNKTTYTKKSLKKNKTYYFKVTSYKIENSKKIKTTSSILKVKTKKKTSATPLSFRSSAPVDTFQEVKVDGETVDSSNYAVTEGSTIVTFTEAYSKTLSYGNHTVDIVSTIGTASANIEIIKSL